MGVRLKTPVLVQWFPGRTNTICRSSCVSALIRGVSNRLLRPVSWHQIRHRCSLPPSPRRWPRCRTFLHYRVCVLELSEPRLHPEGQRKRRGGSDGASMMRYFSKFMYLVYLVEFGFKFHCILRVDKHNGSINRLLKALSKPKAVHERLEEKQQYIVICLMGPWWLLNGSRTRRRHSWSYDNSEGQQFILMALSAIALDTYWGDPGRDHTPTTRSNHQRLRLRLQHNGGHGGGRLLPWEHNKSHGWQDLSQEGN